MINQLLGKVFGTKNERVIKSLMPKVQAINALEPEMQKRTDAELRAKTNEFRHRIQERLNFVAGSNGNPPPGSEADPELEVEDDLDRIKRLEKEQYEALQEVLDEILVEAFAVVREAGRRVLNMRHFDVQLIGGIVLHLGKIAEMKTGEGKTLVATLPLVLNALGGSGAHLVTVNDYLARRDAGWMAPLYDLLGLSVGVGGDGIQDDRVVRAVAAGIDQHRALQSQDPLQLPELLQRSVRRRVGAVVGERELVRRTKDVAVGVGVALAVAVTVAVGVAVDVDVAVAVGVAVMVAVGVAVFVAVAVEVAVTVDVAVAVAVDVDVAVAVGVAV